MKKLLKSIIENNKSKVVVENAILTVSTVGATVRACNYCIFRHKACPDVFFRKDCSSSCGDDIGMSYFITDYEEISPQNNREQ